MGVILAGGLARRMGGGDKCRLMVGSRSILARTVACLAPQVDGLAINANGDATRFADVGLPVLGDAMPGHPGPLAGVLAGLDWADGADWVVSVSADCPFLPGDLVARLHASLHAGLDAGLHAGGAEARYAVAASGGWTHPVIGLWPTACRGALREALLAGERKIDRFTGRARTARVEWAVEPVDPFFNVNTAEDLVAATRIARAMEGGAAAP